MFAVNHLPIEIATDLKKIIAVQEEKKKLFSSEWTVIFFLIFLSTTPKSTVMSLSFRTDWHMQTVQTQIRLLLEEQSDQGLHYLPFHLKLLDTFLHSEIILVKF